MGKLNKMNDILSAKYQLKRLRGKDTPTAKQRMCGQTHGLIPVTIGKTTIFIKKEIEKDIYEHYQNWLLSDKEKDAVAWIANELNIPIQYPIAVLKYHNLDE